MDAEGQNLFRSVNSYLIPILQSIEHIPRLKHSSNTTTVSAINEISTANLNCNYGQNPLVLWKSHLSRVKSSYTQELLAQLH